MFQKLKKQFFFLDSDMKNYLPKFEISGLNGLAIIKKTYKDTYMPSNIGKYLLKNSR